MGSKSKHGGEKKLKRKSEIKREASTDGDIEMKHTPSRVKKEVEEDNEQPCSSQSTNTPMVKRGDGSSRPMDARKEFVLPLEKINPQITCPICKGYFIEATTVTECLHTFCKSCLLSHFEEGHSNCPKCDIIIHQSHPSHYVSFDRTMQDIVHKLVPGLNHEETERRKDHRAARRKAAGKEEIVKEEKEDDHNTNRCYTEDDPRLSHHRGDDQVVVRLIPERGLEPVSRPVVRTSHMTTINTLKRYLSLIMWNDSSKYNQVDLFCNGELMGRDYSMRFIQITKWRHHKPGTPLALTYRPHIEF
ncbi:hypothetical protein PFISCL1PPCAC_14867 [Pristionchus fissidentatus]|uniref:RING-type domain-containing protein n=1 Tax=Pristionchus fissidentatus TaxID=1538716 RepID=A0AAV5VVL7_9BILA|nr:hypothetical protein PFISCL1PPCAC_14867 [Pristionchus fissidentatus]